MKVAAKKKKLIGGVIKIIFPEWSSLFWETERTRDSC
jgi:hypothetical protein